MEEKEPNKVQKYLVRVFKHDLPKEDFEELKTLIKNWVANKLIEGMTNDLKDKKGEKAKGDTTKKQ